MAKYASCPNCGNTEKGYQLSQCKNCGRVFCIKSEGWASTSGCGSLKCPGCGGKNSDTRIIGYIAN